MDEQIKIDLKNMVGFVNQYITSKNSSDIEEIQKIFQKLFDVEFAKLWKFNSYDESVVLLSSDLKCNVDTSLLKQSISNKSIVICKHLTSDKYYQEEIDNPLKVKAKSLMIFPIMKEKNVLGILKLYIGLRQKKIFTKNDESLLKIFSSVLLSLFELNEITKEKLLDLTKKLHSTEEKKIVLQEKLKEKPKEKILKPISKVIENKKNTIDWESKYKELETSMQKYKTLDTSLKALEEKEKKYISTIKTQIKNIQIYKRNEDSYGVKQISLEKEVGALNKSYQLLDETYRKSLKDQYKETEGFKNEKDFLFSKIKELKTKAKEREEEGESLEQSFKYFNPLFFERESAYLCFSIMSYAISSPQGMIYLDEQLQKDKFLKNLVNNYSFFMVNNEEVETKKFINMIEKYEKDIFARKISFKVIKKEGIPEKLIFDAPKVSNSILLILNSLYKFFNNNKTLDIHFSFKDSLFKINIALVIEQKDSFVLRKTQDKVVDELENLLCFKLSKKLITRLKGNFNINYRQDYYIMSLDIPVKI